VETVPAVLRTRVRVTTLTGAADDDRAQLLTVDQAASILALSPYSVRRLIWTGRLPVVRLTRRVRIDRRDIHRLIEQQKERFNDGS